MNKIWHRTPRRELGLTSGFFSRPGMVFVPTFRVVIIPSDSACPPCGGRQNIVSKVPKMTKIWHGAVILKREVGEKKAGEKFLPYLWTFESATNRGCAPTLSPPKYSILSLAIFCHFLFNVTAAPGRRVGWSRPKKSAEYSKSSSSQLCKTFDRMEIRSIFAEYGALK